MSIFLYLFIYLRVYLFIYLFILTVVVFFVCLGFFFTAFQSRLTFHQTILPFKTLNDFACCFGNAL